MFKKISLGLFICICGFDAMTQAQWVDGDTAMVTNDQVLINHGRNGLVLNGSMGGDNISKYQAQFTFDDFNVAESGIKINKKNWGGNFDLFNAFYDGNELFVINSSGMVGIGQTNPSKFLHIGKGRNALSIVGKMGGDNFTDYQAEFTFTDNGVAESGIKINKKNWGGNFDLFNAYYNGIEIFVINSSGNVGIGTVSPDSKLAVNGSIHSKEVKVDLTNWPDYVFDKTYELLPLNEVETYILENNHLPEIPNEEEVVNNGLNIGEMNALLLQKIEELTLYLIEQNKKIEVQQSKIELLNEKVRALGSN